MCVIAIFFVLSHLKKKILCDETMGMLELKGEGNIEIM